MTTVQAWFHVDQAVGRRSAHRWAYCHLVADVPRDLVIDHLCRNPSCVNPAHLEPVTNQVNTVRGVIKEAQAERARKITRCPVGHEYTPANTGFSLKPTGSRSRRCLLCDSVRGSAEYRRAVRELLIDLCAKRLAALKESAK